MKGKTRLLVVLVLAGAVLAALVPVTGLAEGNKTYVTGEECFVQVLDPGIWEELRNGNWRITGMQHQYTEEMTDPRITGDSYVVASGIVDLVVGSGHIHGTLEIVNDQGSWFGHWTYRAESWTEFDIHAILNGSGAYEGLVANYHYGPGEECSPASGYIVELDGD